MKNSEIYKRTISDENIYAAIYSLESYVFEKYLLSDDDVKLLNDLGDKYNNLLVKQTIKRCKRRLKRLFLSEDYLLSISVYFKPKKRENDKVEFRPIHTADLITQICIVAMLNQVMFDDNSGKRELSSISKLIPSHFYGNLPSTQVELLFQPWARKYKDYSDNIIQANKEYYSTEKYKYEVNLDLKKFYPSVDPRYVYQYIMKKVPVTFSAEDKKFYSFLLKKLLFFKVKFDKSNNSNYYDFDIEKLKLNVGLPQGLPQAYFFGNICMIDIAERIDEVFDGDSYYYVDDSVIFTNNNYDNFYSKVSELNGRFDYSIDNSLFTDKINSFSDRVKYKISLHEDEGGKSTITPVESGEFLYSLAKPASAISFEIRAAIDDFEDEILYKKVKTLKEYVDKRLEIPKMGANNKKLAKTKNTTLLQRYKKFYTYRLRLLEQKRELLKRNYEDTLNSFISNYNLKGAVGQGFFDKLEDGIFYYEALILLKEFRVDVTLQNKLLKTVLDFEFIITNNFAINQYYSKCFASHISSINLIPVEYESLKKDVQKIPKIKKLEEGTEYYNNESILVYNFSKKHFKFVANNSKLFIRQLLNAHYSYSYNVQISDDLLFFRMDNRPLQYNQLRLLLFLRLYDFSRNGFNNLLKSLSTKESINNDNSIDLSLLEILPIFRKYISNANDIDTLVLAHRYVKSIWENGSKFLHFYTSHNVEHSIALIKNSVRITKAIDYLTIKEEEYFPLFLACYFHDISMVIHPNLDSFSANNYETDIISTAWKNEVFNFNNNVFSKVDIKLSILDFYKKVNEYFETNIRNNHHKLSALFIKEQQDLGFINTLMRQFVAIVSEAHGYDTKDVYSRKSFAKQDMYSPKYLMIILRLADLLDMSKDRMSINILHQNISNMSNFSKFHWISHLAIDNCIIQTDFENYLNNSKIIEKVQITIFLNVEQLSEVESNKCKKTSILQDNKESNSFIISINKDIQENDCSTCNFMCKWMHHKHAFLFDELFALQRYLDNNKEQNIFNTEFSVRIVYNNSNVLQSNYIDIINKHIN